MKLSFRKKVLFSFIAVFLAFTLLLYPLLYIFIQKIQKDELWRRNEKIISQLQELQSVEAMVAQLKEKEGLFFFQVSLLDEQGKVLYDSHRFLNERKFQEEDYFARPEVKKALNSGRGEELRYSPLFEENMDYLAESFSFQGKLYLLRAGFPYSEVELLIAEFTRSFVLFTSVLLLAFVILAIVVIHYLTRPIKKIIEGIKDYEKREGRGEFVFTMENQLSSKDEFGLLAATIHSLSKKIEHQIKTLMQERNEKAAILESLGEGVVAVNKKGEVTYINQTAASFLDLDKQGIVGKEFMLADKKEYYELMVEAQTKRESVVAMIKSIKKPKRYLDVMAVPREGGGVILVLQDKTSLHKVIEKGQDFIANASHELKTPITIIRGFTETLHDHPELTKEVTLEITKKIVSNCHRMNTLVKNLLTLATLDEGLPTSRMQACDLNDLVEKAKQMIITIYPTARISIIIQGQEKPWLWADGDLLFQAILNLLDNAAKYSTPPAEITVQLEKQAKEVIVEIRDKGIGIPSEEVERIFERFYAVNKSHSRSLGGSGLGLSIVESIIDKHGGRIIVESEVGEGTTFKVIFPKIEIDHLG